MEVYEHRIRSVVEASLHASSMTELCARYGISRPTGYLWLERYRADWVGRGAGRQSPTAVQPQPNRPAHRTAYCPVAPPAA